VVLIVTLTPIIYGIGVMFLYGREYHLPWRVIPSKAVIVAVIGFDVIWFVAMKLWKAKNVHLKVILTILLLVLSAVILSDLYLIHMWHHMW